MLYSHFRACITLGRIKWIMKSKIDYLHVFLITITSLFIPFRGICPAGDLPLKTVRHLFDLNSSLKHPSDVAIDPRGRILVLDGVNSKVKIFSPDGQFRFVFGSEGSGNGEFLSPMGIDVDKKGNIYVADSGNHRIQVFNSSGDYKFQFTLKDAINGKPPDPTDVAVDLALNRCYVVDNDNHRILLYTADGSRLLKKWGQKGNKVGQFHYPFLAAVGPKSKLYVVDVLNTRVQVLNPAGDNISVVGSWGVDRGRLYRPKGVAVDKLGRIYISDSYLGTVQIFDERGNFIAVLGNGQGEILRFNTPVGLAVDEHSRIFVVEMVKDRVGVYQIVE